MDPGLRLAACGISPGDIVSVATQDVPATPTKNSGLIFVGCMPLGLVSGLLTGNVTVVNTLNVVSTRCRK